MSAGAEALRKNWPSAQPPLGAILSEYAALCVFWDCYRASFLTLLQHSAGPMTSQLGGPVNYAFFSLWLALGFSGWIIACSGMSALQRYENHSGISVLGASLVLLLLMPCRASSLFLCCDTLQLLITFALLSAC